MVIVSQSYGLTHEDLRETLKFCERFGLEVDISSWPSWHFPSAVLTLTFARAGWREEQWEERAERRAAAVKEAVEQ